MEIMINWDLIPTIIVALCIYDLGKAVGNIIHAILWGSSR